MDNMKESDWKIFRELHPIALQRAFDQTAPEIQRLSTEAGKSSKDRFWATFDYLKDQREEIGRLFDDFRRSTALLQLAFIVRKNYITADELARFSPDAQDFVRGVLKL